MTGGDIPQPSPPTYVSGGFINPGDSSYYSMHNSKIIDRIDARLNSLVSCIVMTAEANAILLRALAPDADAETAESFETAASYLYSAIEEAAPS